MLGETLLPGAAWGPAEAPLPASSPDPAYGSLLPRCSFGSAFKTADLNPPRVLQNGVVDSFKSLCGLSLGNKSNALFLCVGNAGGDKRAH